MEQEKLDTLKAAEKNAAKYKTWAALLLGVVIGMLISPRRKVRYCIGSYNSANDNSEEASVKKPDGNDDFDYYDDYDYDYGDNGDDDDPTPGGNAIKF